MWSVSPELPPGWVKATQTLVFVLCVMIKCNTRPFTFPGNRHRSGEMQTPPHAHTLPPLRVWGRGLSSLAPCPSPPHLLVGSYRCCISRTTLPLGYRSYGNTPYPQPKRSSQGGLLESHTRNKHKLKSWWIESHNSQNL